MTIKKLVDAVVVKFNGKACHYQLQVAQHVAERVGAEKWAKLFADKEMRQAVKVWCEVYRIPVSKHDIEMNTVGFNVWMEGLDGALRRAFGK